MTASRNATLRFDVKLHVLNATKLEPFARDLPACIGGRRYGRILPKEVVQESMAEIKKASDERVRELADVQASAQGPGSNRPDRIVGPLLVAAEPPIIRLLYDASYGLADIQEVEDNEMGGLVRIVTVWDGGIEPTVWSRAEVKNGLPSIDYGYHYSTRKAVNTPSLEAFYRESFNEETKDGYDADVVNDWIMEHAAAIVLITKAAAARNPDWFELMKNADGTPI